MGSHEPPGREISKTAVRLKEAGGNIDAAITLARFAVNLAPQDPIVLANAGNVMVKTAHADESRRLTAKAIQLDPRLEPKLLHNLGGAAGYDGDMHNCLVTLRRAEQTPDAQHDLAYMTLLAGDWPNGLRLMEVRRTTRGYPNVGVPEWDGKPVDGTLWVEVEQGFGDSFQSARFLPWARTQCKRLVLSAHPMSMALFYGYPGVDEVRLLEENVPSPEASAHVPIDSLAHFYGATPDNLPADPGHFTKVGKAWPVSCERHPRAAISVGLVWAGNPKHPNDRDRSIDFDKLMPILEESRAQFFSLQWGPRGDDPKIIGVTALIEDLREHARTWMRTCAILSSLDLVITVDTAVAHMAGAMGIPTWLMVSKVPDWRWGLKGERAPWYPSVRIFRQKQFGNWSHVVEMLKLELGREITRRSAEQKAA